MFLKLLQKGEARDLHKKLLRQIAEKMPAKIMTSIMMIFKNICWREKEGGQGSREGNRRTEVQRGEGEAVAAAVMAAMVLGGVHTLGCCDWGRTTPERISWLPLADTSLKMKRSTFLSFSTQVEEEQKASRIPFQFQLFVPLLLSLSCVWLAAGLGRGKGVNREMGKQDFQQTWGGGCFFPSLKVP